MADDETSRKVAARYKVGQLEAKERLHKLEVLAGKRKNFSEADVSTAYALANGLCEGCGQELDEDGRGNWKNTDAWQADHKDGDPMNNAAGNIQVLCSTCHLKKSYD